MLTGAQWNESVTLVVVLVPLNSEREVAAIMHLSEQKVIPRIILRTLNIELVFAALAHQKTVRVPLGLAVEDVYFADDGRRLLLGGAPTGLQVVTIIIGTSAIIFHYVPLMGALASNLIKGSFMRVRVC